MLPWGCSGTSRSSRPDLSQAGESPAAVRAPCCLTSGLEGAGGRPRACRGRMLGTRGAWASVGKAGPRGRAEGPGAAVGVPPETWLLQGRGFEDKSACGCAAGLPGGRGMELIPRAGRGCLSPRPPHGDSPHGQGQGCTPGCPEASSGPDTQEQPRAGSRGPGRRLPGLVCRTWCSCPRFVANRLGTLPLQPHSHCGHHRGEADRSGLGRSHRGSEAAPEAQGRKGKRAVLCRWPRAGCV